MDDYQEWYNNIKDHKSLGYCLCYKQTKLERLLASTLPYIIPFISKRRRVIIRNYWKYRYSRRACTALCNLLKNMEYRPFIMPEITKEDFEWEVISNYAQTESSNDRQHSTPCS